MLLFEDDQILVVEKPSGISTHRPNEDTVGFVEWLSEKRGLPLFVVHRLDSDTSGVMLFAKSSDAAASAAADLEDAASIKCYRFLTDQNVSFRKKSHASFISKVGAAWTSQTGGGTDAIATAPKNAVTEFNYLGKIGELHEWEAQIQSGKTHQIRLHAQDLGLSIFGDTPYGGSSFFRVCLHSTELYLPQSRSYSSRAPWKEFKSGNLVWHLAHARRLDFLFAFPTDSETFQTYRVLHREDPDLRADRFGDVLWGYWYRSSEPSEKTRVEFATFATEIGCAHWTLRWMIDRGRSDYQKVEWSSEHFPVSWIAVEGSAKFEFRRETGSSAGLFLDQRANRRWLSKNAHGARILNLFCYTSGFGVVAALGGAREVANIDVQKSVLDWSRRNFELNNLTGSSVQTEFWKADSFYFLERTAARGRYFDLIICDPPSFARNENGVFRIETDLRNLITAMLKCLSEDGMILFTTNFEGWSAQEFVENVESSLPKNGCVIKKMPSPDGDFEAFSGRAGQTAILKSCLIARTTTP